MAGATNRALKSAGLPKSTIKTVRVESGGRLNLQSAIAIARSKGLDVGKAHEHLAKAAVEVQLTPQSATGRTATPVMQRGGAPAGRRSDLRKAPLGGGSVDARVTPTVLKEYFSPNLSSIAVNRRHRLANFSQALGDAVAKAPEGAKVVRFQVGALGEGGPRGSGEHRKFQFKARLLPGKGDGGKPMVAVNMIGGSQVRRANAEREQTIRGESNLPGRGITREGGALRIKGRWDASVPFRHRGENVFAVHQQGKLARVVREDGSIVRNSDAIKRGARVLRAMSARDKAGPSPAMMRGAANRAAVAARSTEAARRAALVAASAAKRNRTNPRIIPGNGLRMGSANADFTHRGQAYSVQRDTKTRILDTRGNPVNRPNKALRQRAERVASALISRIKAGKKPVPVAA